MTQRLRHMIDFNDVECRMLRLGMCVGVGGSDSVSREVVYNSRTIDSGRIPCSVHVG